MSAERAAAQKVNRRVFEQWETIAAAALPPGWVNVWARAGRGSEQVSV
jgi:hypothetical protein